MKSSSGEKPGLCIMTWLLAPGPQEIVSIAINALFLVMLLVSWVYNRSLSTEGHVNQLAHDDVWSNERNSKKNSRSRSTLAAAIRAATTTVAGLSSLVISVWNILSATGDAEGAGGSFAKFLEVKELFFLTQSLAWLTLASMFITEATARMPMVVVSGQHQVRILVRVWWIVTFVLATAQFSLSIMEKCFKTSKLEEVVVLVNLVATSVLIVTIFTCGKGEAVEDVSGELDNNTLNGLREQLLDHESSITKAHDDGESYYAGATWWSRLTWRWLNPVLQKGYKSRLELRDVPELAPENDAENLYTHFAQNWSRRGVDNGGGANHVRVTLFRCFWRQFLRTGALALCRTLVMYVGPALISTFVRFKTERHEDVWGGCGLVLILAASKCIDVLTSHHFSFECQNLGMAIRSTLIAVVYRKGIRLANSARQAHGIGQIVNYMSVDVQQLGDVVLQVHNLWLLPIQIGVALTLLYSVVGVSTIAGLATMVIIVVFTTWSSRRQRRFQREVMTAKDARMKATSEALNAMKVIKLQAWEVHFRERVEALRDHEYHWLLKFMYQVLSTVTFIWCTPSIVSVATFACCIMLGTPELTSGRVFTAVATFRILQEPIRNFPQTMISISQAQVSLDRLERYLRGEELDAEAVVEASAEQGLDVRIEGASFAWDGKETSLQAIDMEVKKGELVAVVGTVGSGKSSLLAAMLGEMPKLHGKVSVGGSTAYVPQIAWIQNGSIQENILFGQAMNRRRYMETLHACALERDLVLMEHGDQTEIGERGINLSGGQKQRIQLARAVYQHAHIYLLDDVFSAVDAHTGSAIFKDCVRGVLSAKTIILVTHQVEFLHEADRILVMRDGMITQSGKYDEILQPGTDFEALVAAHNQSMELVEMEHPFDPIDMSFQSDKTGMSPKESLSPHFNEGGDFERDLVKDRTQSQSQLLQNETNSTKKLGSAKLIEDEQREVGHVSWYVYWLYLTKAFGPVCVVALLLTQGIWQSMMLLSDYWLAYETSDEQRGAFSPSKFIRIYILLSIGTWLCVFARTTMVIMMGVKTTQEFYLQMLRSLFRAPMSFFDTTPSGRILSRSSSDQSTLDIMLPFFFSSTLAIYFSLAGVLVVMCQTAWPIIFVILPLTYVYYDYQAYFIATSRELTRMDSITKAPIIHHFSESIAGSMVIRCFKKEHQFSQANVDCINENVRMVFHNNAANEWLGFRLEMIGTIVLCSMALLLVLLPVHLTPPELVGLALSYGLSLNLNLYWAVWLACNLENKMVSVERIQQFTTIPSEAPLVIPNQWPPANWPSKGTIVFQNLQMRYRPNTPIILKGITLTIPGGEKVGVVGRTGSGKSTLIQALFRLTEASAGRIVIDGVDIAMLGLTDLRSKFGIIPQEPTLFEGTVRANIDPLGQYDDNEIWECLKACQLADVIQRKPGKLDSTVSDDGDNWSVGQKQLFCLGRALLKHAKVLVLDEATASVDAQTDGLIQKTVRRAFAQSTVLSIAHRIPTVMDSNKVLVLDAGLVKEFDTPSRLLDNPTSLFAAFVTEYTTRTHYKDDY